MRKTITIRELKAGGAVDDLFAIKSVRNINTYARGYTFQLVLTDPGGEITLKYWGDRDEKRTSDIWKTLSKGFVVNVKGTVSEYKDSLEIHVNPSSGDLIRPLAEGEYEPTDFVAKTSSDINSMKGQLFGLIRKVEDPSCAALLARFFTDEIMVEKFINCPASISHHSNWIGGLLEHTLRVTRLCEVYASLYPDLDRDLLLTGAILHDLGKVREYKVTSIIGATDEGRFKGHLVIGAEMVRDACKGIDGMSEVTALKLEHMMLSNHGLLEYGSPKTPAFPEAQALAMADLTDTRVEDMITVKLNAVTDEDWVYERGMGSIYLK